MAKEITPWTTTPNLVDTRREIDLEKAKEVTPVLMFGVLPPLVAHPQGIDFRPVDHAPPESGEAKADAETDPKDPDPNATSSATSNASSSGTDSSANGLQVQIDPLTIPHPSSLPPSPESHASVVKDLKEDPPPFPLL